MTASSRVANAALFAAGGGLMFGGLARNEEHKHEPLSIGLMLAGMTLVAYASLRTSPSLGAAFGAVVLTAGYVNEHRIREGLPPLPIPGFPFDSEQGNRP